MTPAIAFKELLSPIDPLWLRLVTKSRVVQMADWPSQLLPISARPGGGCSEHRRPLYTQSNAIISGRPERIWLSTSSTQRA
jgi:hypothetical protein